MTNDEDSPCLGPAVAGRDEQAMAATSEHRRPQITLFRLLIAASFVGAGLGCSFAAFNVQESWPDWLKILAMMQFVSAGPLIGAGVFALANRTRLGAYIGFFAGICAGSVALVVVFGREVLWDLRYIIAFTLLAVFAAMVRILQAIAARRNQGSQP